jgi:hypothetical protein
MAALQFLALDQAEIAVLQKLGRVILSQYNSQPVTQPEPTMAEFEVLAKIFARIMQLTTSPNE